MKMWKFHPFQLASFWLCVLLIEHLYNEKICQYVDDTFLFVVEKSIFSPILYVGQNHPAFWYLSSNMSKKLSLLSIVAKVLWIFVSCQVKRQNYPQ